jgi:hypothetical protein
MTIIYLVPIHFIAFKKREDAVAFIREKEFNEEKVAYYNNAFNAKYSEETIIELINTRILEIKLQ